MWLCHNTEKIDNDFFVFSIKSIELRRFIIDKLNKSIYKSTEVFSQALNKNELFYWC
jgi:hypothetical protein